MLLRRSLVFAVPAALALPACQTTELDPAAARMAEKLEIQVDGRGAYREVEYHIVPDAVPKVVRDAMDRLHPGEAFSGAEQESHGGVLYFELSRSVGGREVEAMFTTDGELFSEEVQVPVTAVPAHVRAVVEAYHPQGQVTSWEEIRDGRREVVEYHAKVADGGKHYKETVSPQGDLVGSYLEMPAEIEVPVRR